MYNLNPLMSGYIDEHRHSLTPEKHEELVLLAQNGDREARDALVIDNLALVVHAARPFCKCQMDFDDLFQEGCIALMNTIDIFKPGLGRCFSTFAYNKIRWGISRSVINKASIIRAPLHVKELCIRLQRLEVEFTRELNRVPSLEELAAGAGVTAEKAQRALLSGERPLSLEYPCDDEYEPLGSRIPDCNIPDPEEAALRVRLEKWYARQFIPVLPNGNT